MWSDQHDGRDSTVIVASLARQIADYAKLSLVIAGYHTRPAFLIIGAQKAGTSALWKYLGFHPQIVVPARKEIGFFHRDKVYAKGTDWYHCRFPLRYRLGPEQVTFEATPEYIYYPKCATRMHSYDTDLKLIVLLRDPVDRAYSAWRMFLRLFAERREFMRELAQVANPPGQAWFERMLSGVPYPTFEDAVDAEFEEMAIGKTYGEPSWIRRGLYVDQLHNLYRHFDPGQLLVLDSTSLRTDTASTLDHVCDFLELNRHPWPSRQLQPVHVQSYQTHMSETCRARLQTFFRPHNERLFSLLGRSFDWQ
jgi:hypothetical protein